MSNPLPTIYLARHGETEWSLSGRHTGLTDLPLTDNGRKYAVRLGERLKGMHFPKVFTSPLKRAATTCALAGFGEVSVEEPCLIEWNYGDYEGLTSSEIRTKNPGWFLFRDGCPHGETPTQIGVRADDLISRLRALDEDVLLFSSGHILRVLASRWLGLDASNAEHFLLDTASFSALSYEHTLSHPAIRLWNDTSHIS
ncbi:MAG: histidine phosphatase family protein [Verrucomicrobiota bacterium]|nr:histidine phosphatase family protein [Verrucomicrobiota bacterium]